GAKSRNFRVCTAGVTGHGRECWKEVIPHREEVMIEGVQTFKDFTVLYEREDANPELRIIPGTVLALERSHRITFPEPVFSVGPDYNAEYDQAASRLSYSSPVTPPTVYDYQVASRELTLLKRLEVPGGYSPDRYRVRRVHATAQDGTRIPISLLFRKDA